MHKLVLVSIHILIILNYCNAKGELSTKSNVSSPSSKEIYLLIKNRNRKNLNLLIKPELPKLSSNQIDDHNKAGWIVITIPGALDETIGIETEFKVSLEQLGNYKYFTITGETNSLTPVGTCYNLEAGKCYRVEFSNNLFGTDCRGTEISSPLTVSTEEIKIIPSRKLSFPPQEGVARLPERPSEVLIHN